MKTLSSKLGLLAEICLRMTGMAACLGTLVVMVYNLAYKFSQPRPFKVMIAAVILVPLLMMLTGLLADKVRPTSLAMKRSLT